MNVSPFWKAVVAVIGAAVVAAEAAFVGDNAITHQEWISIGLAIATAIAVYVVPNKP